MEEAKEAKEANPSNASEDRNPALAPTSEEHLDGEDENAPHPTSPKAKKKKKKSKLKSLLSRKLDDEVKLEEVEELISSASLEERKSLSSEEQNRIENIITQLNAKIPGGRKDLADHKFWKTQPVIKFGT
jgi:hypothetical protein